MDCPVCFDSIKTTDRLSCRHIVHSACIIESGKASCPICRADLPEFDGKVKEWPTTEIEWPLIDKLVYWGWLKYSDIPVIDSLNLSANDELGLVKATLMLYCDRWNEHNIMNN